jgi:hypothetical protein
MISTATGPQIKIPARGREKTPKTPFQLPARLADGLGLESGLADASAFAPFRFRPELVPPHLASGPARFRLRAGDGRKRMGCQKRNRQEVKAPNTQIQAPKKLQTSNNKSRVPLRPGGLGRNDADKRRAQPSRSPQPASRRLSERAIDRTKKCAARGANVFGGTPKTAGETRPRSPNQLHRSGLELWCLVFHRCRGAKAIAHLMHSWYSLRA